MSFPSIRQLNEVIAPAVALLGYEFVACEIHPEGGRVILRIYIDSDSGITIRDCEKVSRQIGAVLDVEDLVIGNYALEVSSPGANRVLISEEHFKRFIGRRIKVKMSIPRDNRHNYSGLLSGVSNGNINMVVDGETFILPISEIQKANLVPEN